MEIYALANQKGGVGKTTVALGLAGALAYRGVRVLLIDLDPQASATKVLGIEAEQVCSVADALLEPERFPLTHAVVMTGWGFAVAPAEMALASRESRRSTADEFVLRRHLEHLRGIDVVLIDCPPSLGVLTLNALAAATHVVVVTEPTFLALQGIEELLKTLELVVAHYNPTLELGGVVVNRVERTVEHREGLAEIAAYFGPDLVWAPHIAKRTSLQEGARRGTALREMRSTSARELAETFEHLAARIQVRDAV